MNTVTVLVEKVQTA